MVSSAHRSKRRELTAMAWHTTTRIAEHLYRISEPFGAIEPRVGVATASMYLVIGQERAAYSSSASPRQRRWF
jgi:hypothetical protein